MARTTTAPTTAATSSWTQCEIQLRPRPRGFHLVTEEIVSRLDLGRFEIGLAHLFLQHTSASLTLNENADPDVRTDLEAYFSRIVPENEPWVRHTLEGPDDLPAHVRSVLVGVALTIPVRDGRLALGTWQGIYLGEHRDHGGARTVLVTIQGVNR